MLLIRYSDGELEIEGSEQDYLDLQAKIDKLLNGKYISAIEVLCDARSGPSPYDKNCKKLLIILGAGRNEFSVSGSTLKIESSAIALKNFSDNLPTGIVEYNGQISYHTHYDTCSFSEYISEDSPAIVLSIRKS